MSTSMDLINTIHIYVTLLLAILVIILMVLVIVLLKATNKLESKYRKFMRGGNSKKNLEDLVISYFDKVDDVKQQSDFLKETYNDIDNRIKSCLQKVSMIRYRAFENVGSDLSYSIALLNYDNDGAVLTSIYGRNESTAYAKPIDKGISRYDLSQEEEQVLKEAISKRLA